MNGPARAIAELLPHAGTMVLLDRVVEWDSQHVRCTATSHLARANPLRCADRLSALCGVEYAAQAIAAHGALVNSTSHARTARGFLAAIRGLKISTDRLDTAGGVITVSARTMLVDGNRAIYAFAIDDERCRLLEGRATVATVTMEPTP